MRDHEEAVSGGKTQKRRLHKKKKVKTQRGVSSFVVYYRTLLGFFCLFISCTTFSRGIFTRVSSWFMCLLYFLIQHPLDHRTKFTPFLNKDKEVCFLLFLKVIYLISVLALLLFIITLNFASSVFRYGRCSSQLMDWTSIALKGQLAAICSS